MSKIRFKNIGDVSCILLIFISELFIPSRENLFESSHTPFMQICQVKKTRFNLFTILHHETIPSVEKDAVSHLSKYMSKQA